ncbi:hypothetical protein V2G26_007256 [Clonostachys chloroleuca]
METRHQFTLSNAESTINDSLRIFTDCLSKEWTRTKTPYGLDEALGSVGKPDVLQLDQGEAARQETAAIFLGFGFQTWLAYFLATHHQGRHYPGQKATTETIRAFDQLSNEDRTGVASAIASIESHVTVQDAIRKLMATPKRRRLVEQTCSEQQPTNVAMSSRQIIANGSPSLNNTISITSPTLRIESPSDPAVALAPPVQEQTCTQASYRVIKASEVPYIAMRLFKAHIGTGDGVRHFVLDNGGRLLPVNGFQFQGSLDSDIDGLLGSKISKAIAESPVREQECAEGIVATRWALDEEQAIY